MLKNLRCQRNNLHVDGTQLAGHGAEDTASAELTGIVQQDTGIVVETDIGTVGATDFLLGADDDCIGNGALLGVAARNGALDGDDDLVAYGSVTMAGTAQDADAENLFRTRVVSHQQT